MTIQSYRENFLTPEYKDLQLIKKKLIREDNKPHHAEIYRVQGKLQLNAGQIATASCCFDNALQVQPHSLIDEAKCRRLKALALEQLEKYEDARKENAEALRFAVACPDAEKLQYKIREALERVEAILSESDFSKFPATKLLQLAELLFQKCGCNPEDPDNHLKYKTAQNHCENALLKLNHPRHDFDLKLRSKHLLAYILYRLGKLERNANEKLKLFTRASTHSSEALALYASSIRYAPLAGIATEDIKKNYRLAHKRMMFAEKHVAQLNAESSTHHPQTLQQAKINVSKKTKEASLRLEDFQNVMIRDQLLELQERIKLVKHECIQKEQERLSEIVRIELQNAVSCYAHGKGNQPISSKTEKLSMCITHCKKGIDNAPEPLPLKEVVQLYHLQASSHIELARMYKNLDSYREAYQSCEAAIILLNAHPAEQKKFYIDFSKLMQESSSMLRSLEPAPTPPVYYYYTSFPPQNGQYWASVGSLASEMRGLQLTNGAALQPE